MPTSLFKVIESEANLTGIPVPTLIRQIVKWHRGAAPGRRPDFPPVTLPKRSSTTKQTKSVLLDEVDINHLDKIGAPYGATRVMSLTMALVQWFGIPVFPPVPFK